jgi:hypothetical protein
MQRKHAMSKCTLRYIFTLLMYAGIAIFLIPYFFGAISTGILFLILGGGFAIVCGMLRCYFVEGDCPEHHVGGKPCP